MKTTERTLYDFKTQLEHLAHEHRVKVEVDADSLQLLDQEAFSQIQVDTPETDTTFAFFGYSLSKDQSQVVDILVAINQQAFVQGKIDYSELIPVVIRHELAEMFYHLSTGSQDEQAAHAHALYEEYRYAFELGVADRYLELITHWSSQLPALSAKRFLKENQDMYDYFKAQRLDHSAD